MVPEGFYFMDSHEWALVDGDVASVGISDFAVEQLGDIVFLELPNVGGTVKKGEAFGTIESVKAASDLYSPVSGEVVEVNDVLPSEPDVLQNDPFGAGWIMKVKLSCAEELDSLMDKAGYDEFLKGR